MSNPSNKLTVGSQSQISAAASSGPAASSSAPRARPDVITYSYASGLAYVVPAETYEVRPLPIYRFAKFAPSKRFTDRPPRRIQDAIDIAKESFPELKDVERERISFQIKVNLPSTQESKNALIGRRVWPIVVASLTRFEIVQVRVAPHVAPVTAAVAPSSSQASTVEPPPYTF
jgi:hypothetical protein